jgi:MFS family permease
MNFKARLQYGWVIVAAAFLITFITCGVNYSYGVFFLPLVNEFGWSRGLAAVVVLIAGLVYAVTLPVIGLLADRCGYKWVLSISAALLSIGLILSSQIHDLWQLYVFDGLFIGLSFSASFAIPVALVATWFARRQGLAVGAATLGISLGTAIVPLLITYLISTIGWRSSFLIAGFAVALICIPSALFMRKPRTGEVYGAPGNGGNVQPEVDDNLEYGLTVTEALRTAQFWMLFTIFLFFLLSLGVVMLHIVPYAVDSGMTAIEAATLLTLVGIFGLAGRLISGIVSDRFGTKPVILVCLLSLALINGWIAFNKDPWTFYLFASVYGVVYSGFVTMMVRIARQVFGAKALGSVFGALMVADGIGFGVGPWLAGYIFDLTGSYTISFVSIAAGLVAAAVLTLIVKPAAVKSS